MRKNISKVVKAFEAKTAAVGDSKRTCSTDGETVYSYAMPIAWWCGGAVVVVPVDAGPSMTTRAQIRALRVAFPGAVEAVGPRQW